MKRCRRPRHTCARLAACLFVPAVLSAQPQQAANLDTKEGRARFAIALLEESRAAEGSSGPHYVARSSLEFCASRREFANRKAECEAAQAKVDACMAYVADWKRRQEAWVRASTAAGEPTDGYRGLVITPCPSTLPQTNYTPAVALKVWEDEENEAFRLRLCDERTWPALTAALAAEDIPVAEEELSKYEAGCLTWLNGRTRPREVENARLARSQLDALKEKKRKADEAAVAAAAKAAETAGAVCKPFETIVTAYVAAGRLADVADLLKSTPSQCLASVASAAQRAAGSAAARIAGGAAGAPETAVPRDSSGAAGSPRGGAGIGAPQDSVTRARDDTGAGSVPSSAPGRPGGDTAATALATGASGGGTRADPSGAAAPTAAGAAQATAGSSGPDPLAALPRRGGTGGATNLMQGVIGAGGSSGAGDAGGGGAASSGGAIDPSGLTTLAACHSAAEGVPQAARTRAMPKDQNIPVIRATMTLIDDMLPIWQACSAPEAPARIATLKSQRADLLRLCQQTASQPQLCSQPYRP